MAVEGSLLYKALPWSTRDFLRENAYTRLSTVYSQFYNYGYQHSLSETLSLSFGFPTGHELWIGKLATEKLRSLTEVTGALDAQYSRLRKPATRESLLKFREVAEPLALDAYERLSSQTALKLRLLRTLKTIAANDDKRKPARAARTQAEEAFRNEVFGLVDSHELRLDSLERFFELGRRIVRQLEQDSEAEAGCLDTVLTETELHLELDFAVSDS